MQQQQQQVSTLQIRALGALCRLLSQVWRGRIALSIPRLGKVWKCAANLFCAELEKKKNITEICSGLSITVHYFLWVTYIICEIQIFHFNFNFSVSLRCIWTRMFGSAIILTGLRVTSNQQLNNRHSIKKKPIQSNKLYQITRTKRECEHWHRNYWSWGNWQDQQQASVLHMACHFHSFHKENTKSVISKISI